MGCSKTHLHNTSHKKGYTPSEKKSFFSAARLLLLSSQSFSLVIKDISFPFNRGQEKNGPEKNEDYCRLFTEGPVKFSGRTNIGHGLMEW